MPNTSSESAWEIKLNKYNRKNRSYGLTLEDIAKKTNQRTLAIVIHRYESKKVKGSSDNSDYLNSLTKGQLLGHIVNMNYRAHNIISQITFHNKDMDYMRKGFNGNPYTGVSLYP